MTRFNLAAWLRTTACVASLAAFVSCGGGGSVGSGGTGAPLSAAQGTVTGFGSIIVDGARFDDQNVSAVMEDQPGHDVITGAQLGERVEMDFDDAGALRTLRVEAALNGAVDSADTAGGQFVVLGQTVRINTDPAKGPVTQFGGGYTGLASVAAGDIVEVHGIVVPQAGASVIQATRVQHEDALPPFLKVTGIVSNLSGTGFALGTLTVTTANAQVVPAGTTLANGQVVRVMAPPSALTGSTLAASQVRIRKLPQVDKLVQTSGTVASLDTTAHTFLLDTQRVDYSALPGTALAGGSYVRVRGTLAADGTLVASDIDVRDGRQEAEAELHGNISNFDAAAKTFTLRGVAVDASRVTPRNCGSGLADGVFVEVEGSLSATTLIATSVQCEGEPAGGTVERQGTAGSVSATARTFVLTTSSSTVNVSWSDRTYFSGVTPATLDGKRVEIEGMFNGTTLQASKVAVDD